MLTMHESPNYSFRNPKKHNLSNLPHQTVEKLHKNHGVLRGSQLGKQRWRARLGILRVKYEHFRTLCLFHLHRWYFVPSRLWRWNRQSFPKCWHLNYRCRGTTRKKTYDRVGILVIIWLANVFVISAFVFDWYCPCSLEFLHSPTK
jgi:hypothetical protein